MKKSENVKNKTESLIEEIIKSSNSKHFYDNYCQINIWKHVNKSNWHGKESILLLSNFKYLMSFFNLKVGNVFHITLKLDSSKPGTPKQIDILLSKWFSNYRDIIKKLKGKVKVTKYLAIKEFDTELADGQSFPYPHIHLIVEIERPYHRQIDNVINFLESKWKHGICEAKQVVNAEHLYNIANYLTTKESKSIQRRLPDAYLDTSGITRVYMSRNFSKGSPNRNLYPYFKSEIDRNKNNKKEKSLKPNRAKKKKGTKNKKPKSQPKTYRERLSEEKINVIHKDDEGNHIQYKQYNFPFIKLGLMNLVYKEENKSYSVFLSPVAINNFKTISKLMEKDNLEIYQSVEDVINI